MAKNVQRPFQNPKKADIAPPFSARPAMSRTFLLAAQVPVPVIIFVESRALEDGTAGLRHGELRGLITRFARVYIEFRDGRVDRAHLDRLVGVLTDIFVNRHGIRSWASKLTAWRRAP